MQLNVVRADEVHRLRLGEGASSAGDVELVNEFLAHLGARRFSPATVRAYAYDLLNFLRFLVSRDAGLADVVPTDLFDYLDWQQRPGSTTGVRVARLPVEIVEQVSRDDIGQPGVAGHQEPEEVQQVVGVGADSRRGEATGAQMGEELIDEFDVASRGGALT